MKNPKIILGIESSCDETACAIVQKDGDRVTILSNIVASSADLQAKFGGVIPEQAAREQLKSIIPVIQESLRQAQCKSEDLDAIAVTQGPGLIGSLLVGVETAKVLATIWQKPLIPVNHLLGHFYANWIPPVIAIRQLPEKQSHSLEIASSSFDKLRTPRNDNFTIPQFPCIGLLVSGGHTDLILMTGHGKYKYLGGTRDDAAGECFDKAARLLGLPYPGGPSISKMAEKGNPKAYPLPRPMIENRPAYGWDFSFSGLKTAVANLLHTSEEPKLTSEVKCNLAASIQDAITDVLVAKTLKAVQTFKVEQILVAGGVAANQTLSKKLMVQTLQKKMNVRIFIPTPKLCTDNATMIAAAALFNNKPINPLRLQANPNLSLLHYTTGLSTGLST